VKEEQILQLNVTDFEKSGTQKKTGFNFTLKFRKGRLENVAGLTATAKELSDVLLQDSLTTDLLEQGEYYLSMNSKFVLGIRFVPIQPEAASSTLATVYDV
jgi:hypothetical protein